tara:strand:- start:688 stop:1161 length:474 start_codon:yes stop_codon:yes gene_type:complete
VKDDPDHISHESERFLSGKCAEDAFASYLHYNGVTYTRPGYHHRGHTYEPIKGDVGDFIVNGKTIDVKHIGTINWTCLEDHPYNNLVAGFVHSWESKPNIMVFLCKDLTHSYFIQDSQISLFKLSSQLEKLRNIEMPNYLIDKKHVQFRSLLETKYG